MEDARRTRLVSIRFTDAELAGLQDEAAALGGMATAIRACVSDREARRQEFLMLSRIYGMLKVIAEWNEAQAPSDAMPIRAHLLAIEAELTRLTRQIEQRP